MGIGFAARAEARTIDNQTAAKLARRYVTLAGSEQNALLLAHSLRHGERVVLRHDDGVSRACFATVFDIPTQAMTWDEVAICLALVEQSLARKGMRHPTGPQLQGALLDVLSQTLSHRADPDPIRGKGG